MFSSALKSFSSNINSNYNISQTPTSSSGPWKIYDAKKKSSGRSVSVFTLDRKSIDAHASALHRSSSSSMKRASEEVLERLRKEASSLARLRHPNILELVEPVEETRNGGLQFVTETVTASLSALLKKKNSREREDAPSRNSVQPFLEEARVRNEDDEIELNELEIQKGLEQISRALEFLHDNACLVHGNLTPDAVIINSKCDWKLSGLGFSSPPDGSTKISSIVPINLSEALNIDPRLPKCTQINLDYCSPDFILDNNLNTAADMFSLGLFIIALYNFPHTSPLKTNSSVTTYKRLFSSSSTLPSSSNGFLSSRLLPADLTNYVLPRLLTRWPSQRMTAKEFQQSPFFNNVLVATIRFLESFPAKTPSDKVQFMKGLSGVIPSFPETVLEKKIITALLDEMKDPELLSLILQNLFRIIGQLKSGRECFTKKIMPRMKKIFVAVDTPKMLHERDPLKDAGLMIVLENVKTISENCSAKDFKDHILPIIQLAIESPVHSVVDASLRSLPIYLPILDFTTVKNELFPIIASVFAKTNSLGIKVQGLDAFFTLCGGLNDLENSTDDLNGVFDTSRTAKKDYSLTVLDKYTMQEKIIPLIRAIKTKEPTVAIAALNVLRQVGLVADPEFIATEIFPILWNMSLGPLLNLDQFQSFIKLIRELSDRVDKEHSKKLRELSGSSDSKTNTNTAFTSSSCSTTNITGKSLESTTMDFERLVRKCDDGSESFKPLDSGWDDAPTSTSQSLISSMANDLAWSTPNSINSTSMTSTNSSISSTVTPKLSCFDPLNTTSTMYHPKPIRQVNSFSIPLQPQTSSTVPQPSVSRLMSANLRSETLSEINWNKAVGTSPKGVFSSFAHSAHIPPNNTLSHLSLDLDSRPKTGYSTQVSIKNPRVELEGSTLSAPPSSRINTFSIPPPQIQTQISITPVSQQQKKPINFPLPPSISTQSQQMSFKNGLDSWQSLI